MAWINSNVSAGTQNTSSNQNTYGTHTPTISSNYDNAFNAYKASMGGNGANAPQQQALDWMQWSLGPDNQTASNITGQNSNLLGLSNQIGGVNGQYQGLVGQPNNQSAAVGMNAAQAASPTGSTAYTAASQVSPYSSLFGSQVTDPALAAYDYGTMRGLTELDARTGANGGWANSRTSSIPYSDYLSEQNLGRGQLSANLNQQGLTSALGFADSDAGRLTSNSQFNSGQNTQNNQFNAGLSQNANQFNAQNQTANNQFNVNAANQQDQNRLAALNSISGNLASQAGLSNQIVQNLVTANGIDTQAAQNLFQSGAITQAQLQSVLDAAGQYNGYSYTQDQTGNTNTNYIRTNIGVGSAG